MCIIKAGLCYQLSEQARGWHSADSQWEEQMLIGRDQVD